MLMLDAMALVLLRRHGDLAINCSPIDTLVLPSTESLTRFNLGRERTIAFANRAPYLLTGLMKRAELGVILVARWLALSLGLWHEKRSGYGFLLVYYPVQVPLPPTRIFRELWSLLSSSEAPLLQSSSKIAALVVTLVVVVKLVQERRLPEVSGHIE